MVSSGRSPSAGRRERREVVRRGGSGLDCLEERGWVEGSAVKGSSGSGEAVVSFDKKGGDPEEANSSGGW